MKLQEKLLNISELLSRFKVQVGILNAVSMLDINIVAEDFLIPVLNEVFDCNFKNANTIKKQFPAIGLIDKLNKTAFQITSTSTPKKIRETLEKIAKNNFYNDYDRFYILIITTKNKKYNDSMLNSSTSGKFEFTNDNIIDIEELFAIIKSLSYEKIGKIEKYLNSQYTDIQNTNNILNQNLPLINKKIDSFDKKYLKSKLETAYSVRQEWYDKKSFFETSLPSISDINQKFSIEKSIKECNQKIEYYENEIVKVTNKVNNEEN